ncbi:MAG TPA: hypothetical protein VLO11_07320 [Luteolibacter sp.]|nr:hypothetical protein [Luteolibacter sp.]
MKLKPKPLSLAAALATMTVLAVWLNSSNDTPDPDAVERQSRAPREKHAGELKRSLSPSRIAQPVRELSKEDLMAIYDREGAAAALAAAKSQPWPYRDDKVYFLLTHMATGNPEFVAAELISSGLNTFLKAGLVDTILKNWKDGSKVLDWAEKQLIGELRCKAVAGALGILVKSDPQAAFDYFENMPACEARSRTIPELFAAWGSHDPATALMRAIELTPDEARSATEHVVRGWAKTDPAAAAAWVLQTAPTDGRWIAGVYQSWISVSPEQAKLWFDALPEGDAKRTAYALTHHSSGTLTMPVFSTQLVPDHSWTTKPVSDRNNTDLIHWAIQDTEGARAFVEENGNDPASKQLSAQVAKAIAGKHGPSAAMEWVLRLPEENGNREMALSTVFYDWSEKDPAAAGAMLASMPPASCPFPWSIPGSTRIRPRRQNGWRHGKMETKRPWSRA